MNNNKIIMVENFNNTQQFINTNNKLLENINKCIENSIIYDKDCEFNIQKEINEKTINKYKTKYIIKNERALAALSLFSINIENPCVLNFASATNPGGGVLKGSMAQEEGICRCSTLYNVLSNEKFFNNFYKYHRELHNTLYTSKIIYSPNITIINSDTQTPLRLPQEKWKKCNIISCAAPNLREIKIKEKEILDLMKDRIRRICLVAIENKNDGIILGAFGCGAFRNNPMIVSRAFKEILIDEKYGEYFKEIIFAVYDTPKNNMENFNTFNRVFKKYEELN